MCVPRVPWTDLGFGGTEIASGFLALVLSVAARFWGLFLFHMGLAYSWLRCSWPFELRCLANLDREGVSVSFWSWNRLGLIHDNCFLSGSTAEMSFPFVQKEKEGFLLFFSSKSPVIMSQGAKICWQWGPESGVTEAGVRWDGWREDFVTALFLWWESLVV